MIRWLLYVPAHFQVRPPDAVIAFPPFRAHERLRTGIVQLGSCWTLRLRNTPISILPSFSP